MSTMSASLMVRSVMERITEFKLALVVLHVVCYIIPVDITSTLFSELIFGVLMFKY